MVSHYVPIRPCCIHDSLICCACGFSLDMRLQTTGGPLHFIPSPDKTGYLPVRAICGPSPREHQSRFPPSVYKSRKPTHGGKSHLLLRRRRHKHPARWRQTATEPPCWSSVSRVDLSALRLTEDEPRYGSTPTSTIAACHWWLRSLVSQLIG